MGSTAQLLARVQENINSEPLREDEAILVSMNENMTSLLCEPYTRLYDVLTRKELRR